VNTLVLGAGNLLLSDEGFGVHFIRHLQAHYALPDGVEVFDAGTLGLMAAHKLEEADRVYIVDVVAAPGTPGTCVRYDKDDFLLKRIPLKLSPHQVGVQEMLLVSSLRGRCPREIYLIGVIPSSTDPGIGLSPLLQQLLPNLATRLAEELGGCPRSAEHCSASGSAKIPPHLEREDGQATLKPPWGYPEAIW
jgi:hydrogenase maturation protease